MNKLNEKSKFENSLSGKSISRGISIKESIKLFFKINILQLLCGTVMLLISYKFFNNIKEEMI